MRARYQRGSVVRDPRTGTWHFRWKDRETGKRRSQALGCFATKAKAEKAADALRAEWQQPKAQEVTVAHLVGRYQAEEMPERFSTRNSYTSYLKNHVLPKWGSYHLEQVKAPDVKAWLTSLPLAPKSKQSVKLLMGILFSKAQFWGYTANPVNPMQTFRLTKVRRRETPSILTHEQIAALLAELDPMMRVAVQAALCLGLRCSELFALQWGDIDWEQLSIHVRRSIVVGRVDDVKTEYSAAPVPMDPALAEVLLMWRRSTEFNKDTDWVWASPHQAGEKPYLGWRLQQKKLKPAAERAGIGKVGWHTFRHTYRAMLRQSGIPLEVQKDLMRHSDIRITQTYGREDAVQPAHREANSKVVEMVLGGNKAHAVVK